jgi:transcriptional regulator with XRE-family HTH domain
MAENPSTSASGSGLGRAIELYRVHLGWKRKDLSKESGLSYPFISEIENGTKEPSSKSLRQIAEALGMSVLELHQLAADYSDEAVDEPQSLPVTPTWRLIQRDALSESVDLAAQDVDDLGAPLLMSPERAPSRPLPKSVTTLDHAVEAGGLSEDAVREIIRAELEKWTSDQLPSLVRRELQRALADMATPRDPNS